jgi:hypothetical protein
VFTLRFSGSQEGFDDMPLQEFIADKEVIDFSGRTNTPRPAAISRPQGSNLAAGHNTLYCFNNLPLARN